MSFRCARCGEAQPSGTMPERVVVRTREKEYRGGRVGHEIVEEQNMCSDCAEEHRSELPVQ